MDADILYSITPGRAPAPAWNGTEKRSDNALVQILQCADQHPDVGSDQWRAPVPMILKVGDEKDAGKAGVGAVFATLNGVPKNEGHQLGIVDFASQRRHSTRTVILRALSATSPPNTAARAEPVL